MEIKIKANEVVKALDGSPIKMEEKELTFVRGYSLCLASSLRSNDPIRAMLLAQRLIKDEGKDEEVELDPSEVKFVREAVENFNSTSPGGGFTVLVIGQLLLKLDEAPKSEIKSKK